MTSPVDIFIAYSHEDLSFKNELKKFLAPMLREHFVTVWDDHDIEAGQEWDGAIKKRLYGAGIVLLLVSSDSLASEYFYGQEVKVSLERHAKGETVVIPVILRHCDWEPTPLGALEALPEKGKPVVSWPTRDQAFQDVVSKLRRVVEGIRHNRKLASEQAEALRQFQAACQAAEHLFAKKNWQEARKAFQDALPLALPGFTPDKQALDQRLQEISLHEKQAAEAAQKAEAVRRDKEKTEQAQAARQQQEAAERQRQEQLAAAFQRESEAWKAALAANTPEAFDNFLAQFPKSSYRRDAQQHAKVLRTPNPVPNEGNGWENRRVYAALGALLAIILLVWAWSAIGGSGEEAVVTDTEANDYAAAKAAGTLGALDTFIKKVYPEEKFEAQAKVDYTILEKRFRALLKDAKAIADDSKADAILHLDTALMIVPNDIEAKRLRKSLE